MHNHFLDKGRRHLRLQPDQVDLILPEHFAASYPKFLQILEAYYEFQEEEKATELLHHIFSTRDITETDITLLSYIEDELLLGDAYFESFATGDAQKRAAANFSNTLFRSKGTKFAIQWFFRSFFNLDAEIVETQNQVFKLNEPASAIGSNSLKFLTDDKLYQTFAYLVRCSIPISEWNELFKLFVHPAGMYLGGELLISDRVFAEMLTLDSDNVIVQSTSPSISITATSGVTESEGTIFSFAITGNNVPSIAPYNYYIETLDSTTEADFAFSNDSTFPDSANRRLFTLIGGNATITIPTRHDSDELETNERFRLFISDEEERIVASQLITVENVVSSYTMTPSAGTIDEGDSVQFSIVGSSVPNNGNTTLFYQVIPVTSDSAGDFRTGTFPQSGLVNPVFIRDDSGSFSVQTKIDGTTEGQEYFSVKLLTQENILKDSATILMNNVAPTFTLTPTPTVNLTEGEDIQINLQVDQTTIGTQVDFVFDDGDDRIVNKTGSFTITGTNQQYTLTNTVDSDVLDIPPTISLTLTTNSGGFFSPELSDAVVVALQNLPPQFTNVSPDTLGQEGDTVVYTVEGTNIPNGNSAKYYIDHFDTNDFDFIGTTPVDSASAENISFTNNSGTISLTFADSAETDNEDFELVILGSADSEVFRLPTTILGSNTYTATPSATNFDEGLQVEVSFTTDDTSQTTYYYYVQGTGITADDFTSGYATEGSRGTVVTTQGGGTGLITLQIKNDQRREGTETFRVLVSPTTSGGVIAQTVDISITDTSLPVYSMQMSPITEGSLLTATVTPDGNYPSDFSESLFVEFYTTSGDSVTFGTPQPPSKIIDADDDDTGVDFSTTTSVSAATGTRTVRANARIDGYDGTVVAFATANIIDAAPSYTLTTNKTNDSANEGDTIQFSFGGSNVPSGTYYYNLADIVPKVMQATTAGQSILLFDSDDNSVLPELQTGMEIAQYPVAFPNKTTISSIYENSGSGDFVDMSEDNNEVSTIPSGTIVYFAQPEVFEDFKTSLSDNRPFGSFSHTTNTTSTFNVDIADSDDVIDVGRTESYTMQVSSDPEGAKLGRTLVSRAFTIGDDDINLTPNVQRGTLANPQTLSAFGLDAQVAQATFRFLTNGTINATTTDAPDGATSSLLVFGNWVDDTGAGFNSSDFEVRVTLSSSGGSINTTGSLGTWLTLSSTRVWSAFTTVPTTSTRFGFAYFDVTIREIANTSNAITTTIQTTLTTLAASGGGGLPV